MNTFSSRLACLLLLATLASCELIPPAWRSDDDAAGARDDAHDPATSALVAQDEATSLPPPEEMLAHDTGSEPPLEVLLSETGDSFRDARPHQEEVEEDAGAAAPPIWARIVAGFKLDHSVQDRRIVQEVAWYSRNQAYLDRVAVRAERYIHYILEEVNARGLPTELVLLPIVESAYDPFAYSHSRAMGLWQFIPATGSLYGLKRDWWYDGRRDIRAATHAALDYLEDLRREFDGDWPLALAAYNSGAGNVRSAIRRNRRKGQSTDFWSLKLLRETSSYVPRLFAIARIVADPGAHGVTLMPIADAPYLAEIDTTTQIDLSLAAELAEISVSELYLLNPGFSRWATRPEGPHTLLIPVGQREAFESNFAALDQSQRVGWRRHRIAWGESLGTIAERYRTTVATLKQVNNLRGDIIQAGASLMVPSALQGSGRYTLSEEQRRNSATRYYARKHGGDPIVHKVASGDNLWDLARKYRVDYRALARWNGIATTEFLQVGQELRIWSDEPPPEVAVTTIAASEGPEVIRKVNYRVRKGESLSLIANKFNLTVSEIKGWNRQLDGRRYIQPGERLTLYVDVMQGGE